MSTTDFDLGQLVEEMEWRKCCPQSKDPEVLLEGFRYFCERYWYIKHPEQGRILFKLFDAQVDTTRGWMTNRYSLMLKARQLGFSTLVATYVFWVTFFYDDRVVIMLSRTERDAVKLLQKAKYGYRFLPEWMKWRGPMTNMTQTKIEFSNESYVESLPSASDPARGEAVWLAVIDEIAYLPNSEEAWASIEPIADVGGRVIALSTANGEGNLFHKLWVGAVNNSNRFKAVFYPWSANGRSQEWYDKKVADLPEWQLAQEYPSDPEDAFLRSGRPLFSPDMLRRLVVREPMFRGDFDEVRGYKFIHRAQGALRVWELPLKDGRYCIGADPAQGYEHGDFCSVHVINVRSGLVVAHWHGRIDPDELGTKVLVPLGQWYNRALIGVESNNHGLTTLKALQRSKYHPLYMQRSPRYKKSVPTDILGWRTSQNTKPLAIDELNQALRDGALELLCADTISELRTFVRDDAGKMTGSPFDDRVMSLAIANQMVKHVFQPQYQPDLEPGPGTMGYIEKMLYGDLPLINGGGERRLAPERIGDQWVRDERIR